MSPAQPLALELLAKLRLSAASGVVCHDGELWVIADDEVLLQRYSFAGDYLGEQLLLADELADEPVARKRLKPDFEMICRLPDGSVLVLGSGSTPQRQRGLWLRAGVVVVLDLAPLYQHLQSQIIALNLEGAVVHGEQLLLAQRGNSTGSRNALIRLDLERVMVSLPRARLEPDCFLESVTVELGQLAGVPLSFTDLCVDDLGRLLFAAAAENTQSSYADGPCAGSALGWLHDDQVRGLWPLQGSAKIEGITPLDDGSLRLVTDPDDRSQFSCLYSLRLADF